MVVIKRVYHLLSGHQPWGDWTAQGYVAAVGPHSAYTPMSLSSPASGTLLRCCSVLLLLGAGALTRGAAVMLLARARSTASSFFSAGGEGISSSVPFSSSDRAAYDVPGWMHW